MTTAAITGIGVVSAFGVGMEPFWEGLLAGRVPLVPGPGGVPQGAVAGVDLRDVVRTPGGRRIDHASLLALAAARLALADAGLAALPATSALALASSLGNLRETPPFLDRVFEKGAGNPLVFPNMVMNAPLSYVSIELGVTGATAMLTEGEVSGEAAILWGARTIADAAAEVCLAGAVDELADILFPVMGEGGALTRATARPFDRDADGRALGEGAAVLVLEPPARARARGARIYAEIVPHPGFGVPAPVHGYPRDPEPVVRGLAPLVADAQLVVAAANGIAAFDRFEATVLARTLDRAGAVVTAPRGAIGDFGAAGALAVAAAALALHDGRVPPTAGCRAPLRDDLPVVCGASRALATRTAVVNGIARGGVCRPVRLERSAA